MKRGVFWSRDALEELKNIARFIAKENPDAARHMATSLRTAGEKLGSHATGRKGRVSGTYEKSLPDLSYILVYALHPRESGDEAVVILRVIHGARDWPKEKWPKD